MKHDFLVRLRGVRAQVEKEFRRNKRRHGERIHCRPGCNDCCHHIFSISEMEAAALSRRLRTLPARLVRLLRQRSRRYLRQRREIFERFGYIEARGNLPPPETRLPCAALVDGRCAVYDERPLICRKYGMPLSHPGRPGRIYACELNFSVGEAWEDPQLVQIQTGIASDWERLQSEYDRAGGRRHALPLSVADALLDDFEKYLPE